MQAQDQAGELDRNYRVEIRGFEDVTGVIGGARYALPIDETAARDLGAAGHVVYEVTPPQAYRSEIEERLKALSAFFGGLTGRTGFG